MGLPEIYEGLSYDDVLLVPRKSSVASRSDVSLKARLTKKLALNVPIISANMDTVTERQMAIAMARTGGLGIIHRFLSIQEQAAKVAKVKRAENLVIENPYTLLPENTLGDALKTREDKGVSGLLVVDAAGKLVGVLTSRDISLEDDVNRKVSEMMTADPVSAIYGISIEDARQILKKNKVEKLPLVDKDGKLRGLITANDIVKSKRHPNAAKDSQGRLLVGAAVGVKDHIERSKALLAAGCDVLVVDIAHGHSEHVIRTIKELKKHFGDVQVIAGNIATYEGATDLAAAGADAVKIGVGPGSICTTRITTGAGVPQLTAVMEASRVTEENGVPTIADGGIRKPGDIAKALAAGASTVMLGNLLAGTTESPGSTILKNGTKYKVIRGMASYGANLGRAAKGDGGKDLDDVVPEGVEALVPYKGSVVETLNQLLGGLRSGMSYCGAFTLEELRRNAKMVKITQAGRIESGAHDVQTL